MRVANVTRSSFAAPRKSISGGQLSHVTITVSFVLKAQTHPWGSKEICIGTYIGFTNSSDKSLIVYGIVQCRRNLNAIMSHLLLGTTTQLLSQAKAEKPLLLGPHPCSLVLGCRAWFSTGTLALMCLRTEILINTRRARGKSPLNPVASAVHIFDVSITPITCMHLSRVLDVGRLVSHL